MDAEDLLGSRKGKEPESPNHALEAEWYQPEPPKVY